MARARGACVGAAALCLGFAILAPKPWAIPGGPAFFAADRPLDATIAIALWWAAALNALAFLLLAATAGLWARPVASLARLMPAPPRSRGFAVLLVLAALLCLGLRWPLAGSSVWPDEAWAVQHSIAGIAKPSRHDPMQLERRVVSWRETLWDWERPTNHVLQSAAARVSTELWRGLSGRPPPDFDERALRLPSVLAAVLSVVWMGGLLAAWGFPRAGVAAAFLLAIHPWLILHGAEGRGYAFLLAFALLASLALTRALAQDRWRAWLTWAVAIWLLIWSQPFGMYLVLALGAAGLAGILWLPAPPGTRGPRIARLIATSALGGMLLFQVMAPNLAQTPGWRDQFVGRESTQLGVAAVGHLWSLAATGIEARIPDAGRDRPPSSYPSLADWQEQRPWVYPLVLGLLPLLVAVGGLRLLARGGPGRWLALGLAGSIPLALLANQASGGQWYPRFAIWLVIVTVGFGAVGLETLLDRVPWPSPRARRSGVALGLLAGVAAFQAFVVPQTLILLTRPQLASRETVVLARVRGGERSLRAVLGLRGGNMHFVLYDPHLDEIENAADLEALAARARAERRSLLVFYAYARKNRSVRPGPFRYLDDPALFTEEDWLEAVRADRAVRILRYTGRPLP